MTRPAASRYRGLRLTVTQGPGTDRVWITLAAKPWTGRWDEWSLLLPAVPADLDTTVTVDVEWLLRMALTAIADRLQDE